MSTSPAELPPKHQARRDQLLGAAIAAIAARGYEGVRLRDVATECGVTTGMIQYYFPSREELLIAAFERSALDQVAGWRNAIDSEPDESKHLTILVDQMMEEFSSHETCVLWMELCSTAAREPLLRPVVAHVFEAWQAIMTDVVRRAADAGTIRPTLLIEDAISILMAAFDGFELSIATSASTITADAAGRQIVILAEQLFPPATATPSIGRSGARELAESGRFCVPMATIFGQSAGRESS